MIWTLWCESFLYVERINVNYVQSCVIVLIMLGYWVIIVFIVVDRHIICDSQYVWYEPIYVSVYVYLLWFGDILSSGYNSFQFPKYSFLDSIKNMCTWCNIWLYSRNPLICVIVLHTKLWPFQHNKHQWLIMLLYTHKKEQITMSTLPNVNSFFSWSVLE